MKKYQPVMSFDEATAASYDELAVRGDEASTVAFLADLAQGGRTLELAIGTGRIALPLAARGVPVDGIDLSPAMVAQLRQKPGGEHIEVHIGNFADVAVPGPYRLIYVVFNTLFNLTTQEEQVRCFVNVANRLEPGGMFVVEGITPADFYRLRNNQYVDAEAIETDRVRLDVARFDPLTQLLDETHVTLSGAGIQLNPVVTRLTWPSELDLMARIAGLRLQERWGGWNREPFTADSRNCISGLGGRPSTQIPWSAHDARRLTGVSYSSGASSVSFSYDNDNRKTGMTDGTGTTSYGYDAAGRLTSRSGPQGGVSYTYDDAGRKASESVNLGTATTFGYDNANHLISVVAPSGTTYYAYDSVGRLVATDYPNGVEEDRTYSSTTGDLTEVWHSKSSGTVTVAKFTYGYDGLGRKTSESQPGSIGIAYSYDDAGQLTDEVRTGGSSFTASYTYDNAGNRLTKTVGSVTENYSYDDANKLTAAGGKSYGYDNAGNVTSVTVGSVTTTVTWDGAGRLTGVSGGGLSTANASTYNGIGQRVEKTDSTGSYDFALADDAIDSRVVADGSATYQHGLGIISETRSSTVKFFHADSLGTARAVTNTSGTKTDALETDAFGMVVATTGTPLGARPFGFAASHGYQTDSDTGLQRLGHRFYDPSTGRFLSRDPIQAGYNWYAYCDNDPVNKVDPEGTLAQALVLLALPGTREVIVAGAVIVVVTAALVVVAAYEVINQAWETAKATLREWWERQTWNPWRRKPKPKQDDDDWTGQVKNPDGTPVDLGKPGPNVRPREKPEEGGEWNGQGVRDPHGNPIDF